jgi:hypothetical protein
MCDAEPIGMCDAEPNPDGIVLVGAQLTPFDCSGLVARVQEAPIGRRRWSIKGLPLRGHDKQRTADQTLPPRRSEPGCQEAAPGGPCHGSNVLTLGRSRHPGASVEHCEDGRAEEIQHSRGDEDQGRGSSNPLGSELAHRISLRLVLGHRALPPGAESGFVAVPLDHGSGGDRETWARRYAA